MADDIHPALAKMFPKGNHRVIDLADAYLTEKRDSHGRWTSMAGLTIKAITDHLKSMPGGSVVRTPEGNYHKNRIDGLFDPDPGNTGSGIRKDAAVLARQHARHPEFATRDAHMVLPEAMQQARGDAKSAGVSPVDPSLLPKTSEPKVEFLQHLQNLHSEDAHVQAQARNRISDIAAQHPEVLDDETVRGAIGESHDIGAQRLLVAHAYKQDAPNRERAAKEEAAREQTAMLDALNDKVSDYEFNRMFGGPMADDGHDVKDFLAANPGLAETERGKALLKHHPELTGKMPDYRTVSKDNEWDMADEVGGFPEDHASIHEEHKAQIKAQFWHDTMPLGLGKSPQTDLKAREVWEAYQSPQAYGAINGELRSGKEPDAGTVSYDPGTPEELRAAVDKMFEDAGTNIPHKMTLYRAIRSSDEPGHDWSKNFKPGTTFTDKGIMSCTAHGKFAQGWLNQDATGRETDTAQENDVVLEIRVPKGQRVVGGSTQFIETMLPPNTPLKIISSEKRRSTPANPLNSLDPEEEGFVYTHVIAEVAK